MSKFAPFPVLGFACIFLFCAFTVPENDPTTKSRDAKHFMLGFEIFKAGDESALNNTDVKIEIYDHTTEKTIIIRDYSQLKTNKFSSISYFENLEYGHDLTFLIQAPGYLAKEMMISFDSTCTLYSNFCVRGLNQPPYPLDGSYVDRYVFPLTLDSVKVGEEVVIPNIHYEYNSAKLQQKSLWVLDSLVKVVELNPELMIELGGHADARGSDDYNMELSERRVQAVQNYLVKQLGNDVKERLVAKGYGETKLLNDCGNGMTCDENLHQANRRTTFSIQAVRKDVEILSLEDRMKARTAMVASL